MMDSTGQDIAEALTHQLAMRQRLQRNLRILELQQAEYGIAIPLEIVTQIGHLHEQLQMIEEEIRRIQDMPIRHTLVKKIANASFDTSAPIPISTETPVPKAQFIAGPPILHPHLFFGRDRIVQRTFHLIKQPPLQNVLIIGPRRSGKTSLLHYIRAVTRTHLAQLRSDQRHNWLSTPDRYRWVMVDFQDARLGRREGLLRHLLTGFGLPIPSPCTLERFLDVATEGLRQPTVVLFDEIGKALQDYKELDDDVWESLRALGPQVGGNLCFVLAAHTSPITLAHTNSHSSPFFNIFGYTATLGPFLEVEARDLIASSPIAFGEDDIAWLLAESQGWPILLQVLCQERLVALEMGDYSTRWREDALLQTAPFRSLLNS